MFMATVHPTYQAVGRAPQQIELESLTSADWIRAGVVMVVSVIAAIVANRAARSVGERTIGPGAASLLIARLVGYLIVLVGLIYALGGLGVRIGPLLGALGLGGLVLAFALQGVVENFFGGLILQSRRPFKVGDTVVLAEQTGVVKDVDSRTVVLRGLDGSWIRVPNAQVLKDPIVTLTQEPYRRSSLTVGVAYASDLQRCTEVLLEALGRVARIRSDPPPLAIVREFGSSSIDFEVQYWHASDVPGELAATHDVVLAVHQALAAAGITIAFPQMTVWSGRDVHDEPYDETDSVVYTHHPGVAGADGDHDDQDSSGGWRRWRRG